MVYRTNTEIEALAADFENCRITAPEWTHHAHLTIALYYLWHHEFDAALIRMRSGIFKLNRAHDTPNTETRGYHETLTVFWLQIVHNFLRDAPRQSLFETANALLIACADSSLPLKSYSREKLFSVVARARFIQPDLTTQPQQRD